MINVDGFHEISEVYRSTGRLEQRRKNFRDDEMICTAGNYRSPGVDLNRNYAYKWGMSSSGSSADPCEEDYRGAKPFSEPET